MRPLLLALALISALGASSVALGQGGGSGRPVGEDAPDTADVVARQVIVRFEPGVSVAERADAREDVGAASARALPLPRVEVLRLEPGQSVPGAVSELNARDDVVFAQPNYVYETEAAPNDTRFGDQWSLHNTGQSGGTADADIDAPEAWDVSVGSDSVVIGIVDTGVNVNHPDLAPNIDPRGRDFAGTDDDVVDDDYEEHGTFVASVAAARGGNGQGMTGVAQRAKILPLQADDGNGFISTDAVVEAVAYAKTAGARVVNMSFGSFGVADAGDDAMEAAIESAPEILFTTSAGNTDPATGLANDNDVKAHWPSNLSADHANVISVASTTRTDALATSSSFGATTVDLGAPGQSILGADALTSVYAQTFDAAATLPAGWTATGSWAVTDEQSNSPSNSLTDSPGTNYDANSDTEATGPSIAAPAGGSACILRNVRNRATGDDHFLTEVAANGSSAFTTIEDRTGSNGGFLSAEPDFAYDASVTSLRFRFRIAANATTADGVHVDDLNLLCNHPDATAFVTGSGTSFAAPAVAGAAAVLLGRNADLTPAQLKTTLKDTVDPLPSLATKTVTGGRLNLNRAVRSIAGPSIGGGTDPPPGGTPTGATTQTTPTTPTDPSVQAPDATGPVISRAAIRPFAFRPLRSGAAIRAAATPRGARVRFAVDEPATVRTRILRARPGRRNAAGRCVAQTRRNRARARCTRHVQVGRATVPGTVRGAVSRVLSGRVGGRALGPGLYRLELRGTDALGNTGAARTTGFRIARRQAARRR